MVNRTLILQTWNSLKEKVGKKNRWILLKKPIKNYTTENQTRLKKAMEYIGMIEGNKSLLTTHLHPLRNEVWRTLENANHMLNHIMKE